MKDDYQILPAEPGYRLWHTEHDGMFPVEPIIGWRVADGLALPIISFQSLNESDFRHGHLVIQCPDERFVFWGGTVADDLPTALKLALAKSEQKKRAKNLETMPPGGQCARTRARSQGSQNKTTAILRPWISFNKINGLKIAKGRKKPKKAKIARS